MKSCNCKVIVIFLIASVQVFPLDADSENCTPGVLVRRNTTYKALPGEELRVECPVEFCSSSPPSVSWVKTEGTLVWVNVSSNSHIKTEWETLKQQYGVSFLIFLNVLRSDSGAYQCESGGGMSHAIFIHINDHGKNTNDTSKETPNGTSITEPTTTSLKQWRTSATLPAQDGLGHFVYRIFGIAAFFIIVISLCVKLNIQCKGKSRNTPDLCPQPSNHIYENDL